MNIIAQGAEAILYKKDDLVIKERISKKYRVPALDNSLRGFRTRREAKVLKKLEELPFPAPRLRKMSDNSMILEMDFIPGRKIKDTLDKNYILLAQEIGMLIARLHASNIIHGDLTTSNMILHDVHKKIYFIDFGLSFFSEKVEDKAVDLFLLDRALESTHMKLYPAAFEEVIAGYTKNSPESLDVLKRFKQVQARGRNKKKD